MPVAALASTADLWGRWQPDPLLWMLLAIAVGLYTRGWQRARRRIARVRPWAFGAGVVAVLLAVASPLDALAGELLSAHMVQHLLLIIVGAPLLAAGWPHLVIPWALPAAGRRRLHRARQLVLPGRDRGAVPVSLLVATGAHLMVLWVWHAPSLYDLALRNDVVHSLEHACFLGTAVALWMALLRPDLRGRIAYGTGVLCIAAILLVGGALGALLTFAETPLYQHYQMSGRWGLTPLDDQHLAGAIMWIPSGMFYGTVAAVLFTRWFATVERWVVDTHGTARAPSVSAAEGGRPAPGDHRGRIPDTR